MPRATLIVTSVIQLVVRSSAAGVSRVPRLLCEVTSNDHLESWFRTSAVLDMLNPGNSDHWSTWLT